MGTNSVSVLAVALMTQFPDGALDKVVGDDPSLWAPAHKWETWKKPPGINLVQL